MNKITFKELAKLSGVSVGTLSRYFNDGYVSKEKANIIKKNIKKYNFIRNKVASRIKKASNEIIILRTVVISNSLDNVIAGIIHNLNNEDVSVKYWGESQKDIIKAIENSIEQRPKALIIFAPIDVSNEFNKIIRKIIAYTKVVILNYKTNLCSTVNVDYKNSFQKVFKINKMINFVYDNPFDVETYSNRVNQLELAGFKITKSINPIKTKLNFFQNERLYNLIKNKDSLKSIVISYRKPIFQNKKPIWIFVDHFFIGILISELIYIKKIEHKMLSAKLVSY